jgi:hypothetical protein
MNKKKNLVVFHLVKSKRIQYADARKIYETLTSGEIDELLIKQKQAAKQHKKDMADQAPEHYWWKA